jgi:hypothetical protein
MRLKPLPNEQNELAARVERIRTLCDDLANALGTAEQWREEVSKMKGDADALYRALSSKV